MASTKQNPRPITSEDALLIAQRVMEGIDDPLGVDLLTMRETEQIFVAYFKYGRSSYYRLHRRLVADAWQGWQPRSGTKFKASVSRVPRPVVEELIREIVRRSVALATIC